ncbi:hypothetical protein EIJ81_00965 (plasmid) [Aliivibrio salmonicida]|uniref:recombinase RecT n=1 Tax=Aliivibrio salmonicida TaxID=40269 RepID=UPI000F6F83F1|nr:recombinase RecT [Aliivibrio salmonicida]AZL83471.1 hypothetical protein EIJ81_00965 [Aliivibrio salmonicida]
MSEESGIYNISIAKHSAQAPANEAQSISGGVLSESVVSYWRELFNAPTEFFNACLSSISFWDDAVKAEMEIFFFLCAAATETQRLQNGISNKNAPFNATGMSVRSALQQLERDGGTFDPILTKNYMLCRYDEESNTSNLEIELTYKGLILKAKEKRLIKDMSVNLVCSNDLFQWKNSKETPKHAFSPFAKLADRGSLIGGYAVTIFNNGEYHVTFVEATLIKNVLNLCKEQSIINVWEEKMIKRTIIRQAEAECQTLFMRNCEDSVEIKSLVKQKNVYPTIKPFMNFLHIKRNKSAIVKATCYAMTFFPNRKDMMIEAEAALNIIKKQSDASGYLDYALALVEPFSIAQGLISLARHNLSLISAKKEVAIIPRMNKGSLYACFEVMYRGLRTLAEKSTFTPEISFIDVHTVYENDKFESFGRYKKPIHEFDPSQGIERGDVIGGFVTIKKGFEITIFVSKETIDKVSNCAKSKSVQQNWNEKYLTKTIIRQSYFDWM